MVTAQHHNSELRTRTYTELKKKSETFHPSMVSGADVKSIADRIELMILNGTHYRGTAAVDRLKYMTDRSLFNVHADVGHGILVRGSIGNKGSHIAVFIK